MILVYEYGLLPPSTNAEHVDTQIRNAHRYRNKLTEIERERRRQVRVVLGEHADVEQITAALADATAQREALRTQIKAARAATRNRSETPLLRIEVQRLSEIVRDLRAQAKAAKAAIIDDMVVRAQLAAIEEWAGAQRRAERAICGAFWGTYLLQEAAADAARKSKTDPKFTRYTGDGAVSVQLQGGLPVERLWGQSTSLQIDAVASTAHDQGVTRGTRRRAQRTRVRLRVGSEGRAPIWAEWPLILHRPLPAGAVIKVATIQRRRRDCRLWDWRLQLTVEVPDAARVAVAGTGAVALNLGWCQRPAGGLRAGYLVGDDHGEHEAIVDRSVLDRLAVAEGVRSERDKLFNGALAAICAWLAAQTNLPDWLRERTTALHAWRAAARLRALARTWAEQRFADDAEGFEPLHAWRLVDERKERYESGTRRHALGHRRETYRILAARLAQRYHTLVIDDTDLRDFQRSPAPEASRVELPAVKYQQVAVAPYELRLVLINAFKRAGAVVKLSAHNVTALCHGCGSHETWNRLAADRMHTCTMCGATWDQDANAARNLLRRHHVEAALAAPVDRLPPRHVRMRAGRAEATS